MVAGVLSRNDKLFVGSLDMGGGGGRKYITSLFCFFFCHGEMIIGYVFRLVEWSSMISREASALDGGSMFCAFFS